jgi:hypothetical protein
MSTKKTNKNRWLNDYKQIIINERLRTLKRDKNRPDREKYKKVAKVRFVL